MLEDKPVTQITEEETNTIQRLRATADYMDSCLNKKEAWAYRKDACQIINTAALRSLSNPGEHKEIMYTDLPSSYEEMIANRERKEIRLLLLLSDDSPLFGKIVKLLEEDFNA